MPASSRPNFPIWFCPEFPIAEIYVSPKQEHTHKAPHLPALLENIRQHGLVNPVIVLNHRNPQEFHPNTVMTGVNRVWAIKQLGYDSVKAIVTGECPYPCTPVAWDNINAYFPDGEIYLGSQGPRIRGYSNFLKGEFPSATRQGLGAYTHPDAEPIRRVAPRGN